MRRLLLVIALAVCTSAFQVRGAEPDPAALLSSIDKPQLGAAGAVTNVEITLSPNMKLRLTSGAAAPVMAASGPVGLFFSGKGSLEYTSTDKWESTNVRWESKKAADVTVTTSGDTTTIKRDFDQLLLRSAGITLPQIAAGGGADLSAAWTRQLEMSGRNQGTQAAQLVTKQILDAPTAAVAIAEISGGGSPLMYVLDTIDQRDESLYGMIREQEVDNREFASFWLPITLSNQPVGRNRRDFMEPNFLLTRIDYTLVADGENAKLSITETLLPRRSAQRVFLMNLRSAFYDTKMRTRPYKVTSIKDAGGNAVPFHHAADQLAIVLPAKAGAGQAFAITYEIEGNVLHRPYGDSFWQLGTEAWFPQPDLNGQYYTVHSVVKVKKPFTPFAPGDTTRRSTEGDFNVVENHIDKPVQFTVVHAGKYAIAEQTYEDGLTIRVASYAMTNDRAAKQLNNLAYKLIKFYEPWLGPFPWKEFNIIEINDLGFGQAPPATMFITSEAFNPLSDSATQAYSKGVNQRFAHEIAHQYWGHVVKMGTHEEQWLTEAFAEYCSGIAIRELMGKGQFDGLVATWKGNANESKALSSIALANRVRTPGDYMGSIHRVHLIYDKGAFVLAVLHKRLGDAKFLTWLRNLQAGNAWRFATTQDSARLLQKIDGGTDYMPFFEQYYWGTDMPKM